MAARRRGRPPSLVADRHGAAGRTLELVTLTFDDGHEMIIHAMIARPEYLRDL
ncbi:MULTISPECIES: hypothetical protein [Microbacterium]|uniref:hypothetical protein n=1 Tax=Microbacterium TaxID=33882 RepID=UPI000AB60A0E|nr:hypothetical protein [Microbacterium testaceum]